MLAKTETNRSQKGTVKKRRHPGDDAESGGEKKRKGGKGGDKPPEGGRKRLDALSVGYFRRVSERLSEGFEDDEEKGENISDDFGDGDITSQEYDIIMWGTVGLVVKEVALSPEGCRFDSTSCHVTTEVI